MSLRPPPINPQTPMPVYGLFDRTSSSSRPSSSQYQASITTVVPIPEPRAPPSSSLNDNQSVSAQLHDDPLGSGDINASTQGLAPLVHTDDSSQLIDDKLMNSCLEAGQEVGEEEEGISESPRLLDKSSRDKKVKSPGGASKKSVGDNKKDGSSKSKNSKKKGLKKKKSLNKSDKGKDDNDDDEDEEEDNEEEVITLDVIANETIVDQPTVHIRHAKKPDNRSKVASQAPWTFLTKEDLKKSQRMEKALSKTKQKNKDDDDEFRVESFYDSSKLDEEFDRRRRKGQMGV
jgi:hypothetical protein